MNECGSQYIPQWMLGDVRQGRLGDRCDVKPAQYMLHNKQKNSKKKYLGKKKISKKGGCDFILTIKGLVNVCINAIPSNCISDRVQDPLELSKRRILLFLHINNRREKKYNVSRNKGKNIIINMLFVLIECLSGQSEEHQNARIPANGHVQGSRQAGSKEVAGQAGRRRNLLSSI